jgi:hypothetical protein
MLLQRFVFTTHNNNENNENVKNHINKFSLGKLLPFVAANGAAEAQLLAGYLVTRLILNTHPFYVLNGHHWL